MESNERKPETSVVLLVDNFGLSHYTSYLAKGLSTYKKIILYGLSRKDYLVTLKHDSKNIQYYSLEEKLPKGNTIPAIVVKSLLLFFILLIELNKRNYDIVHVQGYLPIFYLLIPMLKLKRKKIFLTIHDVDLMPSSTGIRGILDNMYTRLLIRPNSLSKYSNLIIVHARSLKRKLESKKVDANKIYVVPHFDYNYLLDTYFNNTERSPDKLNSRQFQNILPQNYALFFGYVVPWKGIDVLIDAIKLVSNQMGDKFKLVIAGTHYHGYQSYFDNLFKEGNMIKYKDRIILINKYIHSFEIPEIVESSSFLVLPYTKDFQHSVSGVIPLAYTFSKPVIISNLDPLVEYVEDGKTGLVFEPGNSQQLANCILKLANNKDLCDHMGHNANQKLMKEMSLEECARKIAALYDIRK